MRCRAMVELHAVLERLRGDGLTAPLVEHHMELVTSVSEVLAGQRNMGIMQGI